MWLIWIWRWTLFRLMFGAGLIKLRGDSCWRDLTCLNYYFETQPMPNPLSWYFHWMPHGVHAAGVVINHIVEVIVPFAYFAPQPFASIAGIITILFQGVLIVSGNLSWLNWLTLVLCIPLISDRWLAWLPVHPPADLLDGAGVSRWRCTSWPRSSALLSIAPVMNMLSSRQMMNASFEPLHLVNTYGAFGSITRERYRDRARGDERRDDRPDSTAWREYEFKGKPGDPARRPPQVAPYHLRLDWLMWFEAMAPVAAERLVLQPARRPAARRSRHAEPAADESVSRAARRATFARSTTATRSRRQTSVEQLGGGGTGSSSVRSPHRLDWRLDSSTGYWYLVLGPSLVVGPWRPCQGHERTRDQGLRTDQALRPKYQYSGT